MCRKLQDPERWGETDRKPDTGEAEREIGIEKQNRTGPRKTGTKTERQRREIEMKKI